MLAGCAGERPASVRGFDLTLSCQAAPRTFRMPLPDTEASMTNPGLRCRPVDAARHAPPAGRAQRRDLLLAVDGACFAFDGACAYPCTRRRPIRSRACAPVAGVVAQLLVRRGDAVAAGQPLVCVEAMKMEMWLHAGAAGTVRAVHAWPAASVAAGTLLVELEIDSDG